MGYLRSSNMAVCPLSLAKTAGGGVTGDKTVELYLVGSDPW